MTDIAHNFGSDLVLGPTGDLAGVSGATLTTQRVLRRLLTAPGSYIWNLSYGAGLPLMIGTPVNAARISAIALSQMALEAAVSQAPPPRVDVQADASGVVYLYVRYTDALTNQQVGPLTVPVG